MQRLRLTLRPQTAQAEPGGQLLFSLIIENSSSLAHDVTIGVIGLQHRTYTLDKTTVSILPGGSTVVRLSVQPPIDAVPGRNPFRVQLTAVDDPALHASSIAELVVVSDAAPPVDRATRDQDEAPVAPPVQTAPARSVPDLAGSQAPSWRRSGHPWPARPLVAVFALVALLGLLGVATTRGLANLTSPPAVPTRQPASSPRPTTAEAPPTVTATPFVITIGQ